jgi:transcriptional regulator with XRE-family HTH domain
MPIAQGRQLPLMIENLKLHLKAQGLKQRDIAERLGIGLATVKRWLSGDGLTIKRLEILCDLAKIELCELAIETKNMGSQKLERFTASQERTLGENPQLFFIFFSLLNGWPPEECERELRILPETMKNYLKRLSRLGLIDILAPGRVRLLASRNTAWRKGGPLTKYFEAQQNFVDSGIQSVLNIRDFVRLSEAGEIRVRYLIEELRREIHRIAQADRHDVADNHTWYGFLFFMRPLNMDAIRESMARAG